MKTVMLTGATGFIGSHIAEKLLTSNIRLTLYVRRKNNFIYDMEKRGAKVFTGGPDNLDMLNNSIAGADTVVHCAGATTALTEDGYMKANLGFTENLFTLLKRGQRFLFISSQAAAGPSCPDEQLDEKSDPKPITCYGRSKLLAERLIKDLSLVNSIPYTILRPGVVYGPRERDMYNYFRLIKRGILLQLGSGKKRLSIVYIDDLVNAIILALKQPFRGETYFVSNDEAYTWEDIGAAVRLALKKRVLLKVKVPECMAYPVALISAAISFIKKRPSLINKDKLIEMKQPAWLCSNKKIKKEMGWKPLFSLERGIERTAEWYIEEGWL